MDPSWNDKYTNFCINFIGFHRIYFITHLLPLHDIFIFTTVHSGMKFSNGHNDLRPSYCGP
jgi:hypothetical protein